MNQPVLGPDRCTSGASVVGTPGVDIKFHVVARANAIWNIDSGRSNDFAFETDFLVDTSGGISCLGRDKKKTYYEHGREDSKNCGSLSPLMLILYQSLSINSID